jgi:hypothetical protein
MKRFTIRYKNNPSGLIKIVDSDELLIEEICPICEKQGVINKIHPESLEHVGSPNFKSYRIPPSLLREFADKLEDENK